MTRRRLVAAAAWIALVVAGCGDDAAGRDDAKRDGSSKRAGRGVETRTDGGRPSSVDPSNSDDAEVRRMARQIADLERRVAELERRLGGGDRPDGSADDGRPGDPPARPRAALTQAEIKERDDLRDRVLAGASTPAEARRYWDLLGAEWRADDDAPAPDASPDGRPAEPVRGLLEDLVLPLDAADNRWLKVKAIEDGARGGAASFDDDEARIDVGPCPMSSASPFTLHAFLRTRDAGFSTALMAREADAVGCSLVMGRKAGHVSFESWSWGTVRLTSRHRIDDGAWHEIEVSYDPKTRGAILSVDAVRQDAAILGPGDAPEAMLRIGNNIGADQAFKGDVDDVAVWRRTSHPEAFGAGAPAKGK